MYDLLSRSLGALANPATLLGSSILVEVFAAIFGYDGLALTCLAVSAALVVLFGVLPTANWVVFPLEARFAANPTLPDRVAGIVALGGMERLAQSAYWGRPTLNDPGPIGTLVALGRRYPEAQLVFSGGGGHARISEAAVAKDFISEIGAGNRSITYEDRSRNTLENARLTHDLVRPKSDELWIVVSQAAAMPRAMGVFRKAGWNVIAFPAGYLSHGSGGFLSLNLLDGLTVASVALHEWVGLIVYRAMGYTDEIFPA